MAKVITDNKHYIAIADAIRSASFGEIEGQMAPHEFAHRIAEISTIGQEQGMAEGYTQGFEAGKESGIQSEYDRFWDGYQSSGAAKSYSRAFAGECWVNELFAPKHDIVATNIQAMFQGTAITDITALLEKADVYLDTSQSANVEYAFNSRHITRLPVISTVSAPSLNTTFGWTSSLVTIEKLILKEDGTQTFSSTFNSALALQNIAVEGKIGQNGFNVSWSTKLTHDSLMSILGALQDKTGTSTTWSATLGTTNLAKLTDAEKAIATQKGWTLA